MEGDFFEADAGFEEAVLFFVFVLVDGEEEEAEEEGLVLACCFCLLGEGRFLRGSVVIVSYLLSPCSVDKSSCGGEYRERGWSEVG